MDKITSETIAADNARHSKRVHELQEALDHVHAISDVLSGEEHEIRFRLAVLGGSLTTARDATQLLLRFNEGLVSRVEAEAAARA